MHIFRNLVWSLEFRASGLEFRVRASGLEFRVYRIQNSRNVGLPLLIQSLI